MIYFYFLILNAAINKSGRGYPTRNSSSEEYFRHREGDVLPLLLSINRGNSFKRIDTQANTFIALSAFYDAA